MSEQKPFDLSEIVFVKRIIVGTSNPNDLKSEDYIQQQTDLLNRCLTEKPSGVIIAQEKNVSILRLGEHQMVIQNIVYHVGFKRKPYWLK